MLAIIHPDDVARIKKEAVDQINTEDFLSFEFRVDIPDKEEEIQVQSRTLIFKNNDSKPVRAIGVMQDITEVRDTEYALQKSESFNKKIIESNNDCIKVLDKNGKIVFINQGGIDAFEIEHVNEIIDKPWLELWSGENVDEAEQNLHAALKGNPQSFVGFCETAKGNLRWWEVFLSPLHYSAKAKERLLVVSRDITSRKKTEDALKCSLDLYTMMNAGGLDNIIKHGLKEALSITDSTIACFHFVDNRNKSIVLNSCLNTEGKNEYKVIDKEAIPLIKSAIFQKTVEVGEAVIENEMKDEHFVFPGTKRKLNRCLTIPVFENSEIIAVIGVGNKNEKYTREDVVLLKLIEETIASVYQRKSREQALVQEKQRAKESDRLKSAFLANLSHEIRTPITGIMGFTDLLLHKVKNAENQIKYAQKIKSNSNQLLGIVNDIIDISKIEAGLMPVKKSPTNLRLLISEALSFLEEEKRKRNKVGILLKTHIERGYYNLTVDVDVDKLDQIIKKLLDNALKFTNSGFIEVGIDSLAGKTITFYVKDTGVGIEKDAQKWIFERFRQEDDSLNRKFGGIGLGLAICKGLVELLNGEIWIHSEPNVGTDVYFSIEAENVTGIEKVADFRQPPNS
ncbi:MAG: hypothetical protein C0594_11875 [Marinilabiliales bacterium]|nr:MAG: hypothetical protein C0594_11875 [Marinilabiliales bacterium]